MRATPAIAAFLAALCVACTSSAGTPDRTMTAPHTTVAPHSTPPTSPPTTKPTTTHAPDRPTVPADVPRTGPNTRKGEKPPVMPVAATKHTAAGAKAFAEFFIKTIDWGYATTSSAYMRHYYSRLCSTCANVATGFDTARMKGEHFVGGRVTVDRGYVRSGHAARFVIAVPFAISAFELLTHDGKVDRADGAHAHERFDVTTRWSRGRWRTLQVAVET